MKFHRNFSLLLLLLATHHTFSQSKPKTIPMPADIVGLVQDTAIYTGTYSEKNLFFQNVFFQSDNSKEFVPCITKVIVNGQSTVDAINSNAFEIDFKHFNLKKGDKLIVKVVHHKGCSFKCLNEEVLHNGKPSK